MPHNVEVDQSGKVERTQTDTVLAFSNDTRYAILVSAAVKRSALDELRRQHSSKTVVYLRLFAASLYLLLEKHLPTLGNIVIDTEYWGQDANVRGMLLRLIRRAYPNYPSARIIFTQVGKESPAHQLAWEVHRGMRNADHVVTERELLPLL